MRSMLSLIGIYKPSPSRINYKKLGGPEKKKEQPREEKKELEPQRKFTQSTQQKRLLELHEKIWKPPLKFLRK